MQVRGSYGIKWKSVQFFSPEWYWRYNNYNEFVVDTQLPVEVVKENCIIEISSGNGYDTSYNGSTYGNFELTSNSNLRMKYKAGTSQNGGTRGPYKQRVTIYEWPRPFKSSQFITGIGTSIALPIEVDLLKARFIRNWWYGGSGVYTAAMQPVDGGHIAQGSTVDFGGLTAVDPYVRTHVVEF